MIFNLFFFSHSCRLLNHCFVKTFIHPGGLTHLSLLLRVTGQFWVAKFDPYTVFSIWSGNFVSLCPFHFFPSLSKNKLGPIFSWINKGKVYLGLPLGTRSGFLILTCSLTLKETGFAPLFLSISYFSPVFPWQYLVLRPSPEKCLPSFSFSGFAKVPMEIHRS